MSIYSNVTEQDLINLQILAEQQKQPHQPLENIEGVIHETELGNTVKIMKNNTGFFETNEDRERG